MGWIKRWWPFVTRWRYYRDLRSALAIQGEMRGGEFISSVGQGGQYSCLDTWQEAWCGIHGDLVGLRVCAVAKLLPCTDGHSCMLAGWTTSADYHPILRSSQVEEEPQYRIEEDGESDTGVQP